MCVRTVIYTSHKNTHLTKKDREDPQKTIMEKHSFIGDILEQPNALEQAVLQYPHKIIETVLPRIQDNEITRVVLAGHGSSYNALYPSFLHLCNLPIPVSLWQTAELLHYGMPQIDPHTMLCLNSQSGSSVEIKRLVDSFSEVRPACVVAFTNYCDSPLGEDADIAVPLAAGEEHGVAVKTYISSLILATLFSVQITGGDLEQVKDDLFDLTRSINEYLGKWENKLQEYKDLLVNDNHIIIVGRGPSMGSALNSALNQKEASWIYTEGMNAAEFRHGPLELSDSKLTLIVLEGDERTKGFNLKLAKEVQGYGSQVFWVGNQPPEGVLCIPTPKAAEIFQPAADIIALQLIVLALAERQKKEAGVFRRIGKVVMID